MLRWHQQLSDITPNQTRANSGPFTVRCKRKRIYPMNAIQRCRFYFESVWSYLVFVWCFYSFSFSIRIMPNLQNNISFNNINTSFHLSVVNLTIQKTTVWIWMELQSGSMVVIFKILVSLLLLVIHLLLNKLQNNGKKNNHGRRWV